MMWIKKERKGNQAKQESSIIPIIIDYNYVKGKTGSHEPLKKNIIQKNKLANHNPGSV